MTQAPFSGDLPGGAAEPAPDQAPADGRSRGARRQKLAGYLKAANELRQTYQQAYTTRQSGPPEPDDGDHGLPGSFPDVSIVRSGDEEMVLFPSYARRHVKKEKPPEPASDAPQTGQSEDGRPRTTAEDADYWREEWRRHEDDKAIVDVDVRGWIYSPHRGPMSRKNRLMVGLARQLSGVPAPAPSPTPQPAGSSTHEERVKARSARLEEQLVAKEAEKILEQGQGEADIAERGGYSEQPKRDGDRDSIYSRGSRSNTPDLAQSRDGRLRREGHNLRESLTVSDDDDEGARPITKRQSWNQPADMSPEELSVANANLMARLAPFLTNPVASTPVTVFFYNERTSQSRTIVTNEAGHFSLRAALDFVPTDVRVLASDSLSATEEVRITEPKGVSVISDIDDTIKHSAVGSGAKEIFRNAFIRDLGDLTIDGVKEWYGALAEKGVTFHYVSNSPWQLFPVLLSYSALAGLPSGSFHLKQYSGMLQGIFEPVAERKKGTLSRIMQDFPDRKFILVGDSGEADLEVYTDVVMGNPGRIIGVFIRDITTPVQQGFFDSAADRLEVKANGGDSDAPDDAMASGASRVTTPEIRPALPPRRSVPIVEQRLGPAMGKLIDFGDDEPPAKAEERAAESKPPALPRRPVGSAQSPAPMRPTKPARLQSVPPAGASTMLSREGSDDSPSKKWAPPLPAKPRRLSEQQPVNGSAAPAPGARDTAAPNAAAPAQAPPQGYLPGMRQKAWSAYSKLPSASAMIYGTPTAAATSRPAPPARPPTSSVVSASPQGGSTRDSSPAPPSSQPQTPRRGLTAYPAAAAQYASSRIGTAWSGSNGAMTDEGAPAGAGGSGSTPSANKKLELWKRRWARARDLLDERGVMLRTWRVGTDVEGDALAIVEAALLDHREAEEADLSRQEKGLAKDKHTDAPAQPARPTAGAR